MVSRNGATAEQPWKSDRNWWRLLPGREPKALAEWYRDHLGVDVLSDNYHDPPWQQQAGPTVYAPFPDDTRYFGGGGKQWMINLRVANLDAMAGRDAK